MLSFAGEAGAGPESAAAMAHAGLSSTRGLERFRNQVCIILSQLCV